MSQMNGMREQIIGTYRDTARYYDLAMNLCYLVGFRQWAYRRRALQALHLRPGNTVVEVGCGTGLNFSLIEQVIGPAGRIIGVDLTDAMLAKARRRVQKHGWNNVSLVQADAAEFPFPTGVDAILSTLALSLIPECAQVITHGSTALSPGGSFVVLDVKFPETAPGWQVAARRPIFRPFAVTEEVMARRPWEATRIAMQASLVECSWTELCFGYAFLATGTHKPGNH